MKLTITNVLAVNENQTTYNGESKFDCVAKLVEDDTTFSHTVEAVSEMLKENLSQMVDDDDIATTALEAVSKGFGYQVEWVED